MTPTTLLHTLLLCAALTWGQQSHATADPTPSPAALTRDLQVLHKKSGLPGLSVAVVGQDGPIYQHAFGFADVRRKKPYTLDTVQNVGSVSKTVVGLALVKAISLGYFTLDTPINDILPFQVGMPNLADGPITVRHLATHTSGIVDDGEIYGKSYYLNKYSDKTANLYRYAARELTSTTYDRSLGGFLRSYLEVGGTLYKTSHFKTAPGTEYDYSNVGSALAAYLIEARSGIPFDQFCVTHIFKPLGMHSTAWQLDDTLVRRHATTYNRATRSYPFYALITYPDGGLRTTLHDLSIYLQEMIKGYYGKSSLLPAESFRLLFDKQFADDAIPAGSSKGEPNSGVFWRIKRNGQIGHTGSDPGVTTLMFFDPANGLGRILLTNMELSPPGGDVDQALFESMINIWKRLETAPH